MVTSLANKNYQKSGFEIYDNFVKFLNVNKKNELVTDCEASYVEAILFKAFDSNESEDVTKA